MHQVMKEVISIKRISIVAKIYRYDVRGLFQQSCMTTYCLIFLIIKWLMITV